jgi:hypothetical protein
MRKKSIGYEKKLRTINLQVADPRNKMTASDATRPKAKIANNQEFNNKKSNINDIELNVLTMNLNAQEAELKILLLTNNAMEEVMKGIYIKLANAPRLICNTLNEVVAKGKSCISGRVVGLCFTAVAVTSAAAHYATGNYICSPEVTAYGERIAGIHGINNAIRKNTRACITNATNSGFFKSTIQNNVKSCLDDEKMLADMLENPGPSILTTHNYCSVVVPQEIFKDETSLIAYCDRILNNKVPESTLTGDKFTEKQEKMYNLATTNWKKHFLVVAANMMAMQSMQSNNKVELRF